MIDRTVMVFRESPDMGFVLLDHLIYIVRASGPQHRLDFGPCNIYDVIDSLYHGQLHVDQAAKLLYRLTFATDWVDDNDVCLGCVERYSIT